MLIDGQLYNDNGNAVWKSKAKLKCSICNKKKADRFIEFKNPETYEHFGFACFDFKTDCMQRLFVNFFIKYPDLEYARTRSIEIDCDTIKREPIGLSLRYEILNRDKFKCVLCGNTSKESRLEVDHIVPVSSGGKTTRKNLRTLCFKCNRGKGSKNEILLA